MDKQFISNEKIKKISELTLPLFKENNVDFSYIFGPDQNLKTYELAEINFAVYIKNEIDQETRKTIYGELLKNLKVKIPSNEVKLYILNDTYLDLCLHIISAGILIFESTKGNSIGYGNNMRKLGNIMTFPKKQ